MTLLQIHLTRDRALFAVDSASYITDQGAPGADVLYWPDGEHCAVTKLFPQPHLRAVLTGRGTSTVHQFAARQIRMARDFDHAADLLARSLPTLLGSHAPQGTYKGEPLRHSVTLVGWSPAHGRMACASFENTEEYRCCLAPGPDCESAWSRLLDPVVSTPEWLFDRAQSQARQQEAAAVIRDLMNLEARSLETAATYARKSLAEARERDAAAPYGGRLIVAELTRDGFNMIDAGDLGLPPRRAGALDRVTTMMPALCIAPGAVSSRVTSSVSESVGSSGSSGFSGAVIEGPSITVLAGSGSGLDCSFAGQLSFTLSGSATDTHGGASWGIQLLDLTALTYSGSIAYGSQNTLGFGTSTATTSIDLACRGIVSGLIPGRAYRVTLLVSLSLLTSTGGAATRYSAGSVTGEFFAQEIRV